MPDITKQLNPSSTGQAVEFYRAGTLVTDPAYPYQVKKSPSLLSGVVSASTVRIPAPDATTADVWLTITNGAASSVLVGLKSIHAYADWKTLWGSPSPWIRVYRTTSTPSGGGSVSKFALQGSSNANVTVLCAASAIDVRAAITLAGAGTAPHFWQAVFTRMQTVAAASGAQNLMYEAELLPEELMDTYPLVLQAGETAYAQMQITTTMFSGDVSFFLQAIWEEYTAP